MVRAVTFATLLLALPNALAEPDQVTLAVKSQAKQAVIVSESATQRTRANAQSLADYLQRISGASFSLEVGDGSRGIAIGTRLDFPKLEIDVEFRPNELAQREEYLIRSHSNGLLLIGATDLAAQHAMWDFLHRLGYRQFFPGKTWEVIPRIEELSIAVEAYEKPSYHSRRIWYGFGAWDYAKEPYRDWCEKNRCVEGIELHTGHAYDKLVAGLAKQFETHPEWWPLIQSERRSIRNPKPCLGNPAVRAAMVDEAMKQLVAKPNADSVSIDPSDGGGWCECERCKGLGSITDQAITLANELATAIENKSSKGLVGIYAYNYHSPPPNIAVHPKLVVSVATAFIRGGQSLDEIIAGWSTRGTTLGIREYYSVNTWDRDLPGQARGGNLNYLQETIPAFHDRGARFLSAESSDNWGPNGLGYYFASRMLWKVAEANEKETIVADFLEKAFGSAKEPMATFYDQLDGSRPHLVIDDQYGRMYRALAEARRLTESPETLHRLDELTLYARYATLFQRYTVSSLPNRQAAFEALIRFAYRMRSTMMIHSLAIYRDLPNRDKSVRVPDEAKWNVPEGRNPWKSSEPFQAHEIEGFLQEGIESHPLVEIDFQPKVFSRDWIPFNSRDVPKNAKTGEWGPARGTQIFYTYTEKETDLKLKITGGLIPHYRDRGNVVVTVWKIGGASQTGEQETLVATDRSVPPDGETHAISIHLEEAGLYKVSISDGNDKTLVEWPDELPQVILSDAEHPINKHYNQWMAYFYVPKGTSIIGLFGGEHGEIRDSEDRPQFWLNGRKPNYYSLRVPPGQDGKLWHVRYVRGELRLLNVPPCFSTKPKVLLLPREIVPSESP